MKKNVIVVMFDTLQFNYLSCYGNEWIKTPNMDKFAREGVLFENCYTEGLPTIPCRRAMHTGRYTLPYVGWTPLTMEDTTIADLCWGRPIDTALIFDCPMYRLPKFGYTRSFDKVYFTHGHEGDDYYFEKDELIHLNTDDYMEELSVEEFTKRTNEKAAGATRNEIANYLRQRQYGGEKEENRYVAKTIKKAIEYIEEADRSKQFFLWVDSFDPHEPWDPPSVYNSDMPCPYDPNYKGKDVFLPFPDEVKGLYSEEQLHHIRMLYAELVTLCDKEFGKLLDSVQRLGLDQNTLIMMVSDHGSPMGNGEHGHGIVRKCRPWPYEELAHTPMILKAPGIKAGQRIKSFIQSCDVAPTVCDWLGIGEHPNMQGKSLLPLCRGEVEKIRDFAIAGYYPYSWSIITEDWSYIHWTKPEQTAQEWLAGFATVDYSHIEAVGGKKMSVEESFQTNRDLEECEKDAQTRHKENASLDGTDQWTCTPTSTAEVPEKDELYDRKNDPFQLNNLADKQPEKAKELFNTLREFMTELKLLG